MSETNDARGRGAGWTRWIGIGIGGIVVIALGVWAVMSFQPASEAGAAAPTSASSGIPASPRSTDPAVVSPSPQPTEFSTPAPGDTAPLTKPPTTAEVPLDEPATVAGAVVVEVTSLDERTAGRDVPGEASGPAVAVTVRISNNGADAVDTSGSSVNLTYGGDQQIPAVALTAEEGTVWPESIAPGDSASAVFLFSKPQVPSGDIRVIVDLLATEPDVVFTGPES